MGDGKLGTLTRHPDKIPYNVGLWKFEEHGQDPCGPSCPYNNTKAAINEWPRWGLKNPWDKIGARFLGYLCGMFEPTQDLITTSHLWVRIDNELIFNQWAFERGKAYDNVMHEVLKDRWLKIDGAGGQTGNGVEQDHHIAFELDKGNDFR
jgi:hypothetical protein